MLVLKWDGQDKIHLMSSIEIFLSPDKTIELRVMLDDDTVWLTQAQLIELFQSSKANISEHIKNIFAEGELDRKPTVRKFRTVRAEGKRQVTREIEHYNLDLVLSIGYRVNSKRGTQFRQWASECLKQHLIKGYTINENRIKQLENGLFQLEHAVNLIHQSSQSDGITRRHYPLCIMRFSTIFKKIFSAKNTGRFTWASLFVA
jgi:hypothetical protein